MKVFNIILALLILSSGTIQMQILDSCVEQCCCSSNQQQKEQTCCDKGANPCSCFHQDKTMEPVGRPITTCRDHSLTSQQLWAGVSYTALPPSFIKSHISKTNLNTPLLLGSISLPFLNQINRKIVPPHIGATLWARPTGPVVFLSQNK